MKSVKLRNLRNLLIEPVLGIDSEAGADSRIRRRSFVKFFLRRIMRRKNSDIRIEIP